MTLTAREQLSLLLGRAASLAITEREAQEKLQKTMNALVFFQLALHASAYVIVLLVGGSSL